jgi:hypothetical protein
MTDIKIFYYNTLLEYFTLRLNQYLKVKDFVRVDHYLTKKKELAISFRKLVKH